MDHQELRRRFATLTTAHLADACLRALVPVRCAPAALSTVMPGSRLAGRVAPARHVGSVDIFLEALEGAAPGEVLVVFSLGAIPTGPQRLDVRPPDALASATVGEWVVGREDVVLGDDDGVLFVPAARAGDLFTLAETIRDTERRQAERIRAGVSPAQAAAVRPLPCPAPTDAFPEFPRSSASRGRGH